MKYVLPPEPSYINVERSRAADLRRVRHELGWTQSEMAKALGMTTTFISMMERGTKPVSQRTALAVKYLGTLPYKALSREERIANERAWQVVEAAWGERPNPYLGARLDA